MMKMFCVLTVVVVWLYVFVKSHLILYLKLKNSIVIILQ
jgi:hypothetical protein